MGFRKGSISPGGLGLSTSLGYGSLLKEVGEPKDSCAGDGLPLSCCSIKEVGDLPDSTGILRQAFGPIIGGLGVPTILAYGSHGEEGREPEDPGEKTCGD